MAFSYQHSCLVPAGTDIEAMCRNIVETHERANPSKSFSTQIIREPDARTEHSALYAAAMYAVRRNYSEYKTNRLYVALVAPTASKKRKAGAEVVEPQVVFAAVAYDYFVSV